MACKDAKKKLAEAENLAAENTQPETKEVTEKKAVDRLFFGVDSQIQSDDVLQNNITEFEWAVIMLDHIRIREVTSLADLHLTIDNYCNVCYNNDTTILIK